MNPFVGGQRSRGRQRKRWIDVVKYDMEDLAAQHGGCRASSWMEKKNPCGWPLTSGIHSLKERERSLMNPFQTVRLAHWIELLLTSSSRGHLLLVSLQSTLVFNHIFDYFLLTFMPFFARTTQLSVIDYLSEPKNY